MKFVEVDGIKFEVLPTAQAVLKTVLDPLTAYKAMTTIAMSVQSYREGRVLYFNETLQKVTDKPVEGVPSLDTTKGTELCWG